MSWWDTKHFTSLATQALKTAQKKIDKVLDIKEDIEEEKREEHDGFFNKWLSSEVLASPIEGYSSNESNEILWAVNDQSLVEFQHEGLNIPATVYVEKNEKSKLIGSSRSAFKKFRELKVEDNKISFFDESNGNSTITLSSDSIKDEVPDDKCNSESVNDENINIIDQLPSEIPEKTSFSESEESLFSSLLPLHPVDDIDCAIKKSSAADQLTYFENPTWNDASLSHMVISLDSEFKENTNIDAYLSKHVKSKDIQCETIITYASEEACITNISELISPSEKVLFQEGVEGETMKDECLYQSSPNIVESASMTTLITESSLENSTSASDDMSEGNKTLTGEEGNFLLSNFTNLCETQMKPINSTSAQIDDQTNEEQSRSSSQVNNSPGVVQGMIEEAMNEEGQKAYFETEKSRDENFGSPGGGQTSDKVNSEITMPAESGQTSGHTSADEIDTTTSSDIEIISHMSTPSFLGSSWRQPNGDKHPTMASSGAPTYCDLSPPSKRINIRAGSPSAVAGHRRSDSGSSGQSLQSRNGEDFVSIDYASVRGGFVDIQHRRSKVIALTQQVTSLSSDSDLMKKISELEEILEIREKKVLELSQENLDLRESNTILRNQLHQEESVNEAEKEDLKALSDEFTKRIGESEKRFQAILKEKETLKRALVESENEKKSNVSMAERISKEKDQTISELMLEGEKLSKQQLQLNTAVKKLRTKDKENESIIKALRTSTAEQKAEIERLECILSSKLEAERKYVDNINHINSILKANEEEISRLKNELEDAQEKSKSFKLALDNSYREISELHKARMTDVTEAQKAAASVEMSVKEELLRTLDEQKLNFKKVENQLLLQIEDLHLTMNRTEKEFGRREDALRQEILDLQQRLQEAEERNQELTQSVSAATRPLLRQIETIQSTFAVQSSNFERIEKNLSDRLIESQNQLMSAMEKEQISNDTIMDLSSRVNSLDVQVSSLRQDKARLQAELEMGKSKLGALEETKHIIAAQKDTSIRKLEEEIKDLKKEKILLSNQVDMERMKTDVERKRNVVISDQLKEKEIQLQNWSLKSTPTPQPSEDILRLTPFSSITNDDYQERTLSKSFCLEGSGRPSVYESFRWAPAGSTAIEHFQSQLKLRHGEISQLLSNISELERTRESLSQELVNMSLLNEELQIKLEHHSEVVKQFNEITERHNALLQMYGEKVEEAEELRMDLLDIKEIYKCQMDELLKLKSQHIPS